MGSTFMDDVDCGNLFDQIDDLLDFPPENECMNNILGSDECKEYPSIWNEDIKDDSAANSLFPGCNGSSASDLSAELSVPYDDIIQLEWLSTFVEDSFSGGGMTLAKDTTFVNKDTSQKAFHTSSPVSVLESSSCSSNSNNNSNSSSSNSFNSGMMVIPVAPNHRGTQRARSKRPRPATFSPRSMALQLMPIAHPILVSGPSSESENVLVSKHAKKQCHDQGKKKMKPKIPTLGQKTEAINQNNNNIATTPPQAPVRKCLHCEITKTPQWRAGPLGPKTLCNACGVRFKSGRLFPEYRPAASPTFVPSLHSNSHKKVVEMRNNIVVDKSPAE